MLPNPLHPVVVHFPIVLAVLAPFVALGALWAIRRGTLARRAWSIPAAVLGALVVSGWVAAQTGEREEDRVERVVSERLEERSITGLVGEAESSLLEDRAHDWLG